MTVADGNFAKSLRGGRGGLSMDMGSPYLLPPEIHNSRESLHSLSRTVTHGSHDPYRSMHNHAPGEGSSLRSFHMAEDNASTHTASTRHGHRQDGMNQNLLRNAQRMSQSDMPSVHSPNSQGDSRTTSPPGQAISPPPAHAISPPSSYSIPRKQLSVPNDEAKLAPPGGPEAKGDIRSSDLNALRKSNNYLGAFIHSREASIDRTSGGTSQPDDPAPKPDYGMGGPLTLPSISIDQDPNGMDPEPYDVNDLVVPAIEESLESPPDLIPDATPRTETSAFYTPAETPTEGGLAGLGVSNSGLNSRPLSIVRPLPPEDPNDNAEQRANRIRSFYKEYFDDNAPARAYKVGSADYYEDYGQEYLSDGAIFDPATGKFIVANAPYAEPVTRRAMTPPPRGPPRFQGGGAPRHGPKMSGPLPRGPRSRAFSSASTSHMGPGPGPGHQQRGPRRPRQPPAPLRTLPTPHLITEDAFALPIDFAPPSNFRDQQAGRPQSPFGEFRPYSPSVPAANPLASSYSELSAMPSPYVPLRLDFSSFYPYRKLLLTPRAGTSSASPAPSPRSTSRRRPSSAAPTAPPRTPAASAAAAATAAPCPPRSSTACAPAPTASAVSPRSWSAPTTSSPRR